MCVACRPTTLRHWVGLREIKKRYYDITCISQYTHCVYVATQTAQRRRGIPVWLYKASYTANLYH